jgi:hypothetical protein
VKPRRRLSPHRPLWRASDDLGDVTKG